MYLKKIFLCLILPLALLSCNKGDDGDENNTTQQDTGDIAFYIDNAAPCNSVLITITDSDGNDSSLGLNGNDVFSSGTPTCNDLPVALFANRPHGVYQWTATCGQITISGQLGLNLDCFVAKLVLQ